MKTSFSKASVQRSLRRFFELADDVLRADHRSFGEVFRVFLHFCENDDVMSVITRPLRESRTDATDVDRWYADFLQTGGSFIGSKRYARPVDDDERLSLWYKFFLKLDRDEIDFVDFAVDAFGKTNLDSMVYDFHRHFFESWVRDVGHMLADLNEKVGGMEMVPASTLTVFNVSHLNVTTVTGDGNITAVDGSQITVDVGTLERGFLDDVSSALREAGDEELASEVQDLSSATKPAVLVPVLSSALDRVPTLRERFGLFVNAAGAGATGSLLAEAVKLILAGM